MSRRRYAAHPSEPFPHRLSGAEAAVIIVIVVTAALAMVGGLAGVAVLQLLAGAVLLGAGTIVSLRYGRRVPLTLPAV